MLQRLIHLAAVALVMARLPWDFLRVARVHGWRFTARQFVQGCRLARALGGKRATHVIRMIGGFSIEHRFSAFELDLLISTVVKLAQHPTIDRAKMAGFAYQAGRVIIINRTPSVQGAPRVR